MARYCPLFSGSSGNCTYVATAAGGVLIDAGVSARRIERALLDRDIDPRSIRAIFVTHEHSDHVSGLRVLCKRYGYAVYGTTGTLEALQTMEALVPGIKSEVVPAGGVGVADMLVTAFSTPHDSRESCGYVLTMGDGRRLAVATDIGRMNGSIERELLRCDLVQIESNHDVRMLQCGPYPYSLKQRILGDTGHLSNEACGAVLPALARSGVTQFVLAHLSRENNTPNLAYLTAKTALEQQGLLENRDFRLRVAAPESVDDVWMV